MTAVDGELRRSKVVADLGPVLADVLELGLTGYATVEPQDALLLDADGHGVLALEAGVPVGARHTGTGRTGREALAELSVPGPCRVEVYETERTIPATEDPGSRIPPGLAADRLANDPELANRTRSAAAERGTGERTDGDALEAFLEDEERLAAIQREARSEAVHRAREWGLEAELVAEPTGPDGDERPDSR